MCFTQVCELLAQPGRHYELLPILEAALPLLTAPFAALAAAGIDVGSSSSSGKQQHIEHAAAGLLGRSSQLQEQEVYQLHDELQAVWRGMLGALSRALASTAAVAAGDRAAALAAALSGQPGIAAAASCSMVAGDAAAVRLATAGAASDAAPAAAVMLASKAAAAAPGLCCWDLGSLNLLLLALRCAAGCCRSCICHEDEQANYQRGVLHLIAGCSSWLMRGSSNAPPYALLVDMHLPLACVYVS
jgi:hypothetical protein